MSYLAGDDMRGGYGGADILRGCTVSVDKGEIVVIVGPNGAGKSTAMKALFGMVRLREGDVRLGGESIARLTPQDRVKLGMAFVPQTGNVFTTMTVQENPRDGRLPPPRRHLGQRGARVRPVSRAGGKAPPDRRRIVGRPAPAGGESAAR